MTTRRLYAIGTIRRDAYTRRYRLNSKGAAVTCGACRQPIAATRARWKHTGQTAAHDSYFHQHCDASLQAPEPDQGGPMPPADTRPTPVDTTPAPTRRRRAKTPCTLAALLLMPWPALAAQQGAPTPPDVAAILQADALHAAIALLLAVLAALVTAEWTYDPRADARARRRHQRRDRRAARKD